MIWLLVGTIVPSLIISFACCFVVRRLAPAWKLVDRPGQRKVHHTPTPMGGGVAIWAGVVGALLMGQLALTLIGDAAQSSRNSAASSQNEFLTDSALGKFVAPHIAGLKTRSKQLWTLMAAATLLMLLGLIDDFRGLDWQVRLGVQAAVAAFIVWQGWRLSLFIDQPFVTVPLSIVWIVGLINTFNMLDNMDGLSAGVAAIAAAILAAVILTAPDPITNGPQLFVGGFLLVLVGALLGFLWHNRPPARLFMGDAGSYFIGFCLATATITATFAGEGLPRHAILAPLCVLAVPLYDTITVIWIRLREGRSPFEGDQNHISHRLVELGLSRGQSVAVIYSATAVCGLGAFLLHRVETAAAVVILVVIGMILTGIAYVELNARRRRAGTAKQEQDQAG